MSEIRIIPNNASREGLLTAPELFPGHLGFAIPEFHGNAGGRPFAVHQVLSWSKNGDPKQASFALSSAEADTGIAFTGDLVADAEDACILKATLKNTHDDTIERGHHTMILDTSAAPTLHDRTGARTFVYTDKGWMPINQLTDIQTTPTLRVGCVYSGKTIIWKCIARVDENRVPILAVALDNGYGFAVGHPDWPDGLIIGSDWGSIEPGESKTMTARIYLIKGDAPDLYKRYVEDFK